MIAAIRARARRLRIEGHALYLAARHPGTPWHAKFIIAAMLVYALTPADFVPDVFPVLGIVDDIVFIPLAFALAVRFVPKAVLEECRQRAHNR